MLQCRSNIIFTCKLYQDQTIIVLHNILSLTAATYSVIMEISQSVRLHKGTFRAEALKPLTCASSPRAALWCSHWSNGPHSPRIKNKHFLKAAVPLDCVRQRAQSGSDDERLPPPGFWGRSVVSFFNFGHCRRVWKLSSIHYTLAPRWSLLPV